MHIKFEKVSYEYSPNTPFAHIALQGIDAQFEVGKVNAIIGATGSGKSTLVQHLNGLLQPTSGTLEILDYKIEAGTKARKLKQLRAKVGIVFQFPEMQLFDETVFKDVSFGPKNFGFSEAEIESNVKESLELVGIDASLWERSPLDLSGGQKRRVAIAGILAARPDIIVLDEPTAGLDPQGSVEMMNLFLNLNQKHNKTIIMVTHDMDHVLRYAEHLLVMDEGSVVYEGSTHDFFKTSENVRKLGFVPPKILTFKEALVRKGFKLSDALDLDRIAEEIKENIEL